MDGVGAESGTGERGIGSGAGMLRERRAFDGDGCEFAGGSI